jgi:hypothetical protein
MVVDDRAQRNGAAAMLGIAAGAILIGLASSVRQRWDGTLTQKWVDNKMLDRG